MKKTTYANVFELIDAMGDIEDGPDYFAPDGSYVSQHEQDGVTIYYVTAMTDTGTGYLCCKVEGASSHKEALGFAWS